jgi:hypothetical protein
MENDIDINLKLRSEILDAALSLENLVNKLLLALLLIDNPKRKALSNKSGSLTFKNKIDLLFDLDVLLSEEYQKLLLLMEIRNQFLHNIECNSFEKAAKLLGIDKEKKLLKFFNEDKISDREYQYNSSFDNLKIECMEILVAKMEDRRNQLEDRRKTLVKPTEAQIFFINKYLDIINKVVIICEKNISEIPEVTKLINQLFNTLTDDMESINTSKEYSQIEGELKELRAPEIFKSLLKR